MFNPIPPSTVQPFSGSRPVFREMDEWSGTNQGQAVSYTDGDETTDWSAFVYEAGVTVNPFDFLKVYAKYGTPH